MAQLNDKSITSMADLFNAIDTFLVTDGGFTQDEAPPLSGNGQAGWSIGDLAVQVEWSAQTAFTIHQSTANGTAPLTPGGETGDSNYPSDVDLFGVAMTQAEVWGFTNGDTAADDQTYAHFVLEFNRDGRFVHFGFGHVPDDDKVGDWTGGAYKYGFEWSNTAGDEPANESHRLLLDSNHTSVGTGNNLATMRISGHPVQTGSSKYAAFTSNTGALASNDADGEALAKMKGFIRHGRWPSVIYPHRGNPNNAAIMLCPKEFAIAASSIADEILGRMPGIRGVNIGNIQPKQTITLGSRTWQFFPWAQKLTNQGSGVMASRHAGLAYELV